MVVLLTEMEVLGIPGCERSDEFRCGGFQNGDVPQVRSKEAHLGRRSLQLTAYLGAEHPGGIKMSRYLKATERGTSKICKLPEYEAEHVKC